MYHIFRLINVLVNTILFGEPIFNLTESVKLYLLKPSSKNLSGPEKKWLPSQVPHYS